jgi:hypothetical protein
MQGFARAVAEIICSDRRADAQNSASSRNLVSCGNSICLNVRRDDEIAGRSFAPIARAPASARRLFVISDRMMQSAATVQNAQAKARI